MAINYAKQFGDDLEQKYSRGLVTSEFGLNGAVFISADTLNIPAVDLGGYKEHNREGGWSRQAISNVWYPKKLEHDRSVEFFADVMDVDETNFALSAANITNTFINEHAIPEMDAYRFSKMHQDLTDLGAEINSDAIDETTVMKLFDEFQEQMDDAGVPEMGRVLYCSAAVKRMIKESGDLYRSVNVSDDGKKVQRKIEMLDDVLLKTVPSDRFYTKFDFTNGFKPDETGKKINMVLVHPRSIIAAIKHSAIYLFEPGSHTQGDGWLYQNRSYSDLFVIDRKVDGVKMNIQGE